jgi:hypothetical protein
MPLFSSFDQLTVGNDRQQRAAHLLTCGTHFCPPLPRVAQPYWLLGFGAAGALKYGERAEIRARGVLEVGIDELY